jgi:hypothetical protein
VHNGGCSGHPFRGEVVDNTMPRRKKLRLGLDTPPFSNASINTFGNGVNSIDISEGTKENPIKTSPAASPSAAALVIASLGLGIKSFERHHPVSSHDWPSISGNIVFSKAMQEYQANGSFRRGLPLNDKSLPTPNHSLDVNWTWRNCLHLLEFLASIEDPAKLSSPAPSHCKRQWSNFHQTIQELLYNELVQMEG